MNVLSAAADSARGRRGIPRRTARATTGPSECPRKRRRADAASAMLAFLLLLTGTDAHATFQTWRIESLYSNTDGTVQYVILHESAGLDNEKFLAGHDLTLTHAGFSRTYTFPLDLPTTATASARVLVATQGFADLHLVRPDYVLPAGFLATDGATLSYAGVDQVVYPALPGTGAVAVTRTGTTTPAVAINVAGAAAALPTLPVTAVEYYNAALDHYFISDLAPEIDTLDSARIPGWSRTGLGFKVFPAPTNGAPLTNPVCRFYIPPEHGNSHFFTASPAECATIQAKVTTDPNFSGYVFETPAAFYIAVPDPGTGACAAGLVPVYRLWNQRADSNHRYTTDPGVKAQMLARSYVAEGYGPDATIMCAPRPGEASLHFTQGSAAANGALVSDATSVVAANYQGYGTAGATVAVGPRRGAGEIIAFSARRAVSVQSAAWSTGSGDQVVDVPLATELQTPITIWVVAGPYATTEQTALTLWSTAQQIYWDERMGVTLPLEVVNATANPSAASWAAFTCGAGNANVAAIAGAIGARPGRINVYLVGLVDGSTSRGNACSIGGSFVAIAAGAGAELLAHELGHAFALEHIDDLTTSFDATNVMHSASNVRAFLTEGQVFRAHTRPASAANAVYGARPGGVTRPCDRDTPTLACPGIAKRVFPDGAFPAN